MPVIAVLQPIVYSGHVETQSLELPPGVYTPTLVVNAYRYTDPATSFTLSIQFTFDTEGSTDWTDLGFDIATVGQPVWQPKGQAPTTDPTWALRGPTFTVPAPVLVRAVVDLQGAVTLGGYLII